MNCLDNANRKVKALIIPTNHTPLPRPETGRMFGY